MYIFLAIYLILGLIATGICSAVIKNKMDKAHGLFWNFTIYFVVYTIILVSWPIWVGRMLSNRM